MDRVEQLIRESLQARADDVEPTPMLWLEVDRRVARRKRFQVMTWSLAGATAALAGVLAVPAIVDLVTDDRPAIDIGDVPQTPAGGVVPEFYVTDVDGRLQIRELATGEAALPAGGGFELEAHQMAVKPGSTGADYTILSTHGGPDAPGFLAVVDSSGPIEDGRATEADASSTTLPAYEAAPDFVPSVAWAPDQDAAVVTLPMPEADQTNVVLWTTPRVNEDVDPTELELVLGQGEVELLDWVGQTTDTGDESILYYRDDVGVHAQELTIADDGTLVAGVSRPLFDVLDFASAHSRQGLVDGPHYTLLADESGQAPTLEFANTGGRRVTGQALDEFEGADPADLWIDAKQDAAIVGDGTRTFLYAHDGDGNFVPPVELETSGPAVLFDATRPGQQTPEPEPTDEPTDDATEEPEPEPEPTDAPAPGATEPAPGEGSGTGAALPDPLVTVSMDEMLLHGPDGPQQIAFLPSEGHSVFLAARVRPGSTVDDLTVVALTTAEGSFDLRTVRVVDGEVVEFEAFPAEYRPGGSEVGAGFTVTGPVWSPDGGLLAWFETWDGTTRLRTVGWEDGANGPGTGRSADDNAMFDLGAVPEWPLEPQAWVATGDGRTELWSTVAESRYWYGLEVQIQGDGAPALAAGAEVTTRRPEVPGAISGLAAEGTRVRWLLSDDGGTPVLIDDPGGAREQIELPTDLLPGEGLPDLWVRDLSEGALVGSRNTGVAYYVAPDGSVNQIAGQVTVGDPIR